MGDAGDHREHDERHDQHLQQPEEELADDVHVRRSACPARRTVATAATIPMTMAMRRRLDIASAGGGGMNAPATGIVNGGAPSELRSPPRGALALAACCEIRRGGSGSIFRSWVEPKRRCKDLEGLLSDIVPFHRGLCRTALAIPRKQLDLASVRLGVWARVALAHARPSTRAWVGAEIHRERSTSRGGRCSSSRQWAHT